MISDLTSKEFDILTDKLHRAVRSWSLVEHYQSVSGKGISADVRGMANELQSVESWLWERWTFRR